MYTIGDLHSNYCGEMSYLNSTYFPEGKDLNKNDIVCVLGDFGFIFQQTQSKHEAYWLNWLHEKPWTTVFIDGNHENFQRLAKLKTVIMFGGPVGKVNDSVFHLRRGEVYTFGDKKVFVMGGATSIDKLDRTPGISWWREETPSYKEIDNGFANLEKVNYKVDFIFTHTLPTWYAMQVPGIGGKLNDPVCKILDEIELRTEFKFWYSGHFHKDLEWESAQGQKIYTQYNGIRRVF